MDNYTFSWVKNIFNLLFENCVVKKKTNVNIILSIRILKI